MVVVPRAGDSAEAEVPEKSVYVAEGILGEALGLKQLAELAELAEHTSAVGSDLFVVAAGRSRLLRLHSPLPPSRTP